MDDDGFYDHEDNCAVIANADQLDTDQDGLGDVCDVVVPDMSGIYRVDLTRQTGAMEFDDDIGTCVDIVNDAFLVDIKMQSNQIFLHVLGEDNDGALEQFHFWDDIGRTWVTDDGAEQELFLTENGLEIVDDVYMISGYVSSGETAILEATSDGSLAGIDQQHVELKAFDINGMSVLAVLGENWDYGISPDATFGAGAIAYSATITTQANQFALWCDNDWLDSLALDCANAITTGSDVNGNPLAAVTLDEVAFFDTELASGMM